MAKSVSCALILCFFLSFCVNRACAQPDLPSGGRGIDPVLYDYVFFEEFEVIVAENGDVSVSVCSLLREPFLDQEVLGFIATKDLRVLVLDYFRDGEMSSASLRLRYDAYTTTVDEARVSGERLAKTLCSLLGCDDYVFVDSQVNVVSTNPWTREQSKENMVFIEYDLGSPDLVFSEMLDLYNDARLDDGLSLILDEKFLQRASHIELTYPTSYVKATRVFPGYFELRAGESCLLDVRELLDLTEPLRTSKASSCSLINIYFDVSPGFDYEFTKVYIPLEYHRTTGRTDGSLSEYCYTTAYFMHNIPGQIMDDIVIEFTPVRTVFRLAGPTILVVAVLVGFFLLRRLAARSRSPKPLAEILALTKRTVANMLSG